MADLDLFGADENEEQDEFNPQTSDNLKDVRDWGKQGWKQAKAAEKGLKELEELRAYKADSEKKVKAAGAAEIFEKLGLPKQQATLFTAVSDDVSEEAVKKFAETFGLSVAEKQDNEGAGAQEEVVAPPEKQEGFRPVSGRGSEGFQSGTVYTLEEIQKLLLAGDTARVEDLSKKGKLGLEKLSDIYPTDNRS